MTANPIGLVVVGVGLLIAAIVAVATKTTWFQTIWEYMSHGLAVAWEYLWNVVLAPIIRFVLDGIGSMIGGISNMLLALGHVPGFGWATTAGNAMKGAAAQAHALANGIKDIPDKKNVTIGIGWDIAALPIAKASAAERKALTGHNAAGTDNWRGGPTWVNEKGGEIIDLPSGSRVIPADKSAKMMEGSGIDYDRLAAAMSRAQIVLDGKNVAASIDQRLAPR
jgi:phage-related protein